MKYCVLQCFKAYDVRRRSGLELDGDVDYRVGRTVAHVNGISQLLDEARAYDSR